LLNRISSALRQPTRRPFAFPKTKCELMQSCCHDEEFN